MPITNADALDFGSATRQTLAVQNPDPRAVLHVGVRTDAAYCDLFPTEFALAPGETQTVVVTLRPERAGRSALAAGTATLLGQFIALHPEAEHSLPPDVSVSLPIVLPGQTCPHCGAELPDGARECRRCGERIRPCPVCGVPNTWVARVCRADSSHLLRTEPDWTHSPGGDSCHSLPCPAPKGEHLARLWTIPAYARANTDEWAAPLVAFGMVFASWTDTNAGTARVGAWETATGGPLWEFALPGTQGLYPDRGAMALSADGTLYAATLDGHVVAMDAVRGTRRWAARVAAGAVFGGVTAGDGVVLVPAGKSLHILDSDTGSVRHTVSLQTRTLTAPALAFGTAFCVTESGSVCAINVGTGDVLWQAACGGPVQATPVVCKGLVVVATMGGTLFGFKAASGERVWQAKATDKPISAAPCATSDGLLLAGDDGGQLHVLDAATGNILRSRSVANAPVRVSPVCGGRTAFVGTDDGNLYALDEAWNVSRAYETAPGARISGAGLALAGDVLAFACTDGVLYVCRAAL